MIELLVVVLLLGIIAGLAVPRFDFATLRADAGVRIVRGTLMSAQRAAVMRGYDVVVSFDTTRSRMRVFQDDNGNRTPDAGERTRWTALEEQTYFTTPPAPVVSGEPTAPVTGSRLVDLDGMPSVVFRRSGAASSTLRVYVLSRRGRQDQYRAVSMSQATARTDWYRRIGSAWSAEGP